MSAKPLFAASEPGLFEALADSPIAIDKLAADTGLTRRAARIGADAMVALGWLEREGDRDRFSLHRRLLDVGTDPTPTHRTRATLMAGEFASHARKGEVSGIEEVQSWLDETGSSFIRHAALAGPRSLIGAEATQ